MSIFRSSCYLLILLTLAGCTSPRMGREWRDKPIGFQYEPDNVFAIEQMPENLTRVVVLPFSKAASVNDMMPAVESAMVTALRRQSLFELVRVDAESLYQQLGDDNLTFDKPMPAALLDRLRSTYQADAVLQTEITSFRPYKPLQIGVRSRLFTIDDNRIIWSCDEVLDAGNEKVALGARLYAEKELEQPYPLQSSYSALISPERFAGYVGYILFNTLPRRMVDSN